MIFFVIHIFGLDCTPYEKFGFEVRGDSIHDQSRFPVGGISQNQKNTIAHEIRHVGRSQDNRSPTATQLTERKKNGDDRDIFTISGFQRSSTQILSTKRRPVLHRQSLSSTTDVRSPIHAAVLDQLVDGGDARACYCTLTAAETHPRVLPTT